jgi:hypothetical protein
MERILETIETAIEIAEKADAENETFKKAFPVRLQKVKAEVERLEAELVRAKTELSNAQAVKPLESIKLWSVRLIAA